MPNDPTGSFGARTYAASSKVVTDINQLSVRLDQVVSSKSALFARFSYNQVSGPTTNPDQTAIDPSFGVNFFDHQRNAAVRYSHTMTPHLSFTVGIAYIRSTPFFAATNHTDPALVYGDGLYQGFNTADGSVFGSYGNLYQIRWDATYIHGSHSFQWGLDIRANRDTTIFGTNPNGVYTFGGGTAYSPVAIASASGFHNIQPGQPAYPMDWTGLAPRVSIDYAVTKSTVIHAGGAITTILPNLWQDNFVTGGIPLVFQPVNTALPGIPVPFQNTAVPLALPPAYAINGQLLFPNGDSSKVEANTQVDLQRFQNNLEALTPGHQVQLLTAGVISRSFRNGYIGTYTLGVEQGIGSAKLSAAYVGTAGIHLASVQSPNGYTGGDPAFAPYTQFDSAGHAIGSFGPESIMDTESHSSYNALQTSVTQTATRIGLSYQGRVIHIPNQSMTLAPCWEAFLPMLA